MALILAPKLKADVTKTIKMLIIHDLGEIYAGDHHAFKRIPQNRYQKELLAIKKIVKPLPPDTQEEFISLWIEFEECQSLESRLAKTFDKLEVLIQHNEADISTWSKKEYSFNVVYGDEFCEFNPMLKTLRQLIKDECQKKIEQKSK